MESQNDDLEEGPLSDLSENNIESAEKGKPKLWLQNYALKLAFSYITNLTIPQNWDIFYILYLTSP